MKINQATTYTHQNSLMDQIRSEATSYERMTVHVRNVLVGDLLLNGEEIRQVFTRVYGQDDTVLDSVLIQTTQVRSLRVLDGEHVVVFRPVQP